MAKKHFLTATLPDGTVREVPPGTTPLEVAASIGPRLAQAALGAELDGKLVDLRLPLARGGRFAWSAKELGAKGHHEWVLTERDGGTFVRTEECQRGWSVTPIAPVMRRLMTSYHQRWLEGLARVAAEGPPPA